MMVAALMPLLSTTSKSGLSKALLLGISIAATIGGMGTIIGTSPNAIAIGLLGDNGVKIDFLSWMVYGVPLAVTADDLKKLSWDTEHNPFVYFHQ